MPYVALSDGHGMETAGKRTPVFTDGTKSIETGKSFMHENEFNKAVLKYVDEGLQQHGFKTLLVAPTDEDTPLSVRTNLANSKKVDIYVSVHANAFTGKWGQAQGIETLAGSSSQAKKLAAILHHEVMQGTKFADRRVKDGSHLWELRKTNMPAVLLELGFMDNDREARLLMSDKYRVECANEIVRGICRYFNITFKGMSSPTAAAESDTKTTTMDTTRGIGIVKVNVEDLPLRKLPDGNAELVKLLPKGSVYYAYAEKEGWYDLGGGVWAYSGASRMTFTEHPKKYYRVRKTWEDPASQIGAFVSFVMARGKAEENPEYNVFDESGRCVYPD